MVQLFEGIWSPCCSSFSLKKAAVDNQDKFDADIASMVNRDFYVDDLSKSVKIRRKQSGYTSKYAGYFLLVNLG